MAQKFEGNIDDLAEMVQVLQENFDDATGAIKTERNSDMKLIAQVMRFHGHRHDAIRGGWARDIFKTFEDPEAFSDALKDAIPVGTIMVREGVDPKRVYFKTPTGFFRLVASGTTGAADGHSHSITNVDINFLAT